MLLIKTLRGYSNIMSSRGVRNWFGGLIAIILLATQPGLVLESTHGGLLRNILLQDVQAAETQITVPQAAASLNAKVTEYGYYRALSEIERSRNEQAPSGYERTGGDVVLAKQTQQIPLIKDLLFGFKFHITGFPKDQVAAELTLKVSHPPMTRPDGSRRDSYSYPIPISIWNGEFSDKTGYKFDKNFEMVAGEWKFEYWYKDNLLLSQSFQAVTANEALKQEAMAAMQMPSSDVSSTTAQPQAAAVSAEQASTTQQLQPQTQAQTQAKPQQAVSVPATPKPVRQDALEAQTTPVVANELKEATPHEVAVSPDAQNTAQTKPVSKNLAPAFQKQIQTIMEQYKAMNYDNHQSPADKAKAAASNGPVPEVQTGAGAQATQIVTQPVIPPESSVDAAVTASDTKTGSHQGVVQGNSQ